MPRRLKSQGYAKWLEGEPVTTVSDHSETVVALPETLGPQPETLSEHPETLVEEGPAHSTGPKQPDTPDTPPGAPIPALDSPLRVRPKATSEAILEAKRAIRRAALKSEGQAALLSRIATSALVLWAERLEDEPQGREDSDLTAVLREVMDRLHGRPTQPIRPDYGLSNPANLTPEGRLIFQEVLLGMRGEGRLSMAQHTPAHSAERLSPPAPPPEPVTPQQSEPSGTPRPKGDELAHGAPRENGDEALHGGVLAGGMALLSGILDSEDEIPLEPEEESEVPH